MFGTIKNEVFTSFNRTFMELKSDKLWFPIIMDSMF